MANDNVKKDNEILVYSIDEIMKDRFGRYSKYIIQERALPDVRDGLKPVQRRIIYAMNNLGLSYNKPHKKSARVVGEVIGKYHPHGDTSVYDALVRMSQWWKLRAPLIDMQGNNGSIDGDSAAAMRYTEIRLERITELLLQDIEKNTVSFAPNFDDSEIEPTVLPAYFPNILVNGSTGIASGYATNMPPHNFSEIINAIIATIKNKKIALSEISTIVQGPDFPTGGIVRGKEGITQAFESGKGKIIIQSRIAIENGNLVITEIPYEVIKQDLVRKIADVVDANQSLGVKEVRDETDRTGLRIVIELNPEADSEFVRKFLLKSTPLQINYNYNNVVIINKKPKQVGIIEIINAYINHYKEIYLNRSKFDLAKSEKRLEVIEGLIKAVSILDEVIEIIRKSKNRSDAIVNLIAAFEFTQLQAEAIVDLRLHRLTSTDIVKLSEEQKELNNLIKKLLAIINDQSVLENEIIANLTEIKKTFPLERKSEIIDEIETLDVEIKKTIVEKAVKVWVSKDGYLKVIDAEALIKNTGTEADFKRKPYDYWIASFEATTLNYLILVCSNGTYYLIPIYKIELSKWKDIGMHLNKIATMNGNDTIVGAFLVKSFQDAKQEILLSTEKGLIKRTPIEQLETKMFSKSFRIIKLLPNDKLASAVLVTSAAKFVVMTTAQGYSVRYKIEEIASASPSAKGVKSTTAKEDNVIAGLVNNGEDLLIFTNKGNTKRVKINTIPLMTRPKRGDRLYPVTKRKDENVIFSYNLTTNDTVSILDEDDNLIKLSANNFKVANLEDVNADLDLGEISFAVIERSDIVKNGDIPPQPIYSSDSDLKKDNDEDEDDNQTMEMNNNFTAPTIVNQTSPDTSNKTTIEEDQIKEFHKAIEESLLNPEVTEQDLSKHNHENKIESLTTQQNSNEQTEAKNIEEENIEELKINVNDLIK